MINIKPTWENIDLREALRYAADREVEVEYSTYTWNWSDIPGLTELVGRYDHFYIVRFTDGTALAVITNHEGPYSEVTPDISIYTQIRIIKNWNPTKDRNNAE